MIMRNKISDPIFFEAGRALFTVTNKDNIHYTFKINKHKTAAVWFASMLTGSDNESSYSYIGMYNPSDKSIRLTAKSKVNDDSTAVKVIRWAIKMVNEKKELPEGYSIQHEGKCCRCGRTLTTPESIERGIGPECSNMLFND
jgi:hypothetical protein